MDKTRKILLAVFYVGLAAFFGIVGFGFKKTIEEGASDPRVIAVEKTRILAEALSGDGRISADKYETHEINGFMARVPSKYELSFQRDLAGGGFRARFISGVAGEGGDELSLVLGDMEAVKPPYGAAEAGDYQVLVSPLYPHEESGVFSARIYMESPGGKALSVSAAVYNDGDLENIAGACILLRERLLKYKAKEGVD